MIITDKEILKEARKTAKAKIMVNKDGSIKLKSINKDGSVNKTTTDAINENKDFEDIVKKIKPNEFLKLKPNLRNNDFVVELSDEIKKKLIALGKDVDLKFVVHDTLCRQVSGREPQLKTFASENDVIVFVSGTKSSNGKMLFLSCKEQNKQSYFVSDTKEIDENWFKNFNSVGICGATSTPRWLMDEVADHIKQIC